MGINMKGFLFLTLFIFSHEIYANNLINNTFYAECKTSEIVVDEIIRDTHIRGHINGLPQAAYDKFKVVFYVKTNRWYVHPYSYYEGQEEGYSYSNLNSNGEFKVKTVRRAIPSSELAVVLVPKNYKIKSQKFLLKPFLGLFGGVLKDQCAHVIIPGNGDFFRN